MKITAYDRTLAAYGPDDVIAALDDADARGADVDPEWRAALDRAEARYARVTAFACGARRRRGASGPGVP